MKLKLYLGYGCVNINVSSTVSFVVFSMSQFPIDFVAMKRSIETVLIKFIATYSQCHKWFCLHRSASMALFNLDYAPIQCGITFDGILENALYNVQWCIGYLQHMSEIRVKTACYRHALLTWMEISGILSKPSDFYLIKTKEFKGKKQRKNARKKFNCNGNSHSSHRNWNKFIL